MQRTGSMALQPFVTVVGRMIVLVADCLRPEAGPSLGARVTMKAVHTEGLSDFVRVVSYHTWADIVPDKAMILTCSLLSVGAYIVHW